MKIEPESLKWSKHPNYRSKPLGQSHGIQPNKACFACCSFSKKEEEANNQLNQTEQTSRIQGLEAVNNLAKERDLNGEVVGQQHYWPIVIMHTQVAYSKVNKKEKMHKQNVGCRSLDGLSKVGEGGEERGVG